MLPGHGLPEVWESQLGHRCRKTALAGGYLTESTSSISNSMSCSRFTESAKTSANSTCNGKSARDYAGVNPGVASLGNARRLKKLASCSNMLM